MQSTAKNLNSGQPRTSLLTGKVEDLNPGPQDDKSSLHSLESVGDFTAYLTQFYLSLLST